MDSYFEDIIMYSASLCSRFYFYRLWKAHPVQCPVFISLLSFSRKLMWGRQLPKKVFPFIFWKTLHISVNHQMEPFDICRAKRERKGGLFLGDISNIKRGQRVYPPDCCRFHHLWLDNSSRASRAEVLGQVSCTRQEGQQQRKWSESARRDYKLQLRTWE